MKKIINYDQITEMIPNFRWSYIRFIDAFNYTSYRDKTYDLRFVLNLKCNVEDESGEHYFVEVNFYEPRSIEIKFFGYRLQTTFFEVLDISDNGLEDCDYLVSDQDSLNDLKFYCKKIEITEVKKLSD